jgi:hypothetical protein
MNLFPCRKLITVFFVACFIGIYITPAVSQDYSRRSVTQLIDDLTQIDSQAPGIDSAAVYRGFIADDGPGSFAMGVLGVAPPTVPPQMRELVRRGPIALPELVRHVNDKRPTKLEVGNKDSDQSTHQVGVDYFWWTAFGEEYDPRLRNVLTEEDLKSQPRKSDLPEWKNFQGRYTVKVGDVCYVLIGQIVSRHLLAVRYQPSAGLVVNSPIETPALAEKVRKDWGDADAEMLKASLLADIRVKNDQKGFNQSLYAINPALQRLRLYFPDAYNALQGDDLARKKQFEEQEAKQQEPK